MLLGESLCPEGSEYVGKGGDGVLKAEIQPAEVDPCFKKLFDTIVLLPKHTIKPRFSR